MTVVRHWMIGALALAPMLSVLPVPAHAQDYPTHPVRIITDSAPGSAVDVPVRIIAEGLSKIWGQQAVVINQPGAGGAIAVRTVETASPDGYTLGLRGGVGNRRQSADPRAERL
jgi:tripartite-type tricarboxylate transporter receptor subunit TctC